MRPRIAHPDCHRVQTRDLHLECLNLGRIPAGSYGKESAKQAGALRNGRGPATKQLQSVAFGDHQFCRSVEACLFSSDVRFRDWPPLVRSSVQ